MSGYIEIKYHQVGNVILVDSNSDFDVLVTDGLATGDGGTYYIEGKTITNCGGCRITIKNTDVPFVNVGEMPLDDDDPEFINITNNEFDTNCYGIQLVGFECDISGNDIQNSAGCGAEPGYGSIFMLANGNRIYNNTIEDSDSYGINVYNSTGNCIYENAFINNNGGAVGGGQAWDNSVDCNFWDTTIAVCYFYPIGSSPCHVIRVGNYWGVACDDNNNDGICDNLQVERDGGTRGVDSYPVKDPWCNYEGVKCGNVDCIASVDVVDGGKVYTYADGGPSLNCRKGR